MTDHPLPHTARIDHAHERIDRLEPRVASLETSRDVTAVQLSHIQQSLHSIQSGISRLAWLFVAGLVAAVVAFIVQGGLAP